MSEWVDKRPHGRVMVRNAKIRHEGRYWDARRKMDDADIKELHKILCNHCVYMKSANGKSNEHFCIYSTTTGSCRKCTSFECIPNGFFKQKGCRPLDTERIQGQVEEFVDKLLEGKR